MQIAAAGQCLHEYTVILVDKMVRGEPTNEALERLAAEVLEYQRLVYPRRPSRSKSEHKRRVAQGDPLVADLPGMARQGSLQAVLDALTDNDIPAGCGHRENFDG